MAADEYSLDPTSPSTKYAYAAEAEVPAANPHTTAPAMFELSGEGHKPVELPVTAPSAPSTAGARAVELASPLDSPRETGNRGA